MVTIQAPFDSDEFPKSVLIQSDDIGETNCDECLCAGEDFPKSVGSMGTVPAAMYRAAIYCANCMPKSYDEHSGEQVSTLTGE
jgi:hypothetical protein